MKNSLNARERELWMSATAILLLFALLAVNSARREVQTMRTQQELLASQIASSQTRIQILQQGFLEADDIKAMQRLGLENPKLDLRTNLTQQGKLIPFRGVLGGKMGFYSFDGIKILNRQWVVAPFDDGHVSGQALLNYEVRAGGKISWRIIEATID